MPAILTAADGARICPKGGRGPDPARVGVGTSAKYADAELAMDTRRSKRPNVENTESLPPEQLVQLMHTARRAMSRL